MHCAVRDVDGVDVRESIVQVGGAVGEAVEDDRPRVGSPIVAHRAIETIEAAASAPLAVRDLSRGAGVQCAPFGASGMSIFHTLGDGTNMLNPSHLPSGDQCTSAGPSSVWVICDVAPSASM